MFSSFVNCHIALYPAWSLYSPLPVEDAWSDAAEKGREAPSLGILHCYMGGFYVSDVPSNIQGTLTFSTTNVFFLELALFTCLHSIYPTLPSQSTDCLLFL